MNPAPPIFHAVEKCVPPRGKLPAGCFHILPFGDRRPQAVDARDFLTTPAAATVRRVFNMTALAVASAAARAA